jgi:hypothetical protein
VVALFFEYKKHRKHQKNKPDEMIHPERFRFKNNDNKKGKNNQRDHLLDHFELPEIERPAVFMEPDPVGGNLEDIFEKGNAPTDEDHRKQAELAEIIPLAELQMPVPGEGHKYVGKQQQ